MHRVLVIDDNPDILVVINTFLNIHDISTRGVSDGREVLDEIESFKPDLLLLDVKLGDLDGRAICKQLKSNVNTSHLPVILFSALDNIDDSMKECGMVDFITKPFDLNELIATIKKHIPPKITHEQIENKVKQILVDKLGVNETDCTDSSWIKKDLDANLIELSEVISNCEKHFRIKKLDVYLKGDITVAELVNVIEGLVIGDAD